MSTPTRFLARHGQDVTWRQVSAGNKDSYGDPQRNTSTTTVRAVVERDVTVERVAGREGERRIYEADVYVDESHGISSGPDGFEDEFEIDGETYAVIQVASARSGLKRCICERHGT